MMSLQPSYYIFVLADFPRIVESHCYDALDLCAAAAVAAGLTLYMQPTLVVKLPTELAKNFFFFNKL